MAQSVKCLVCKRVDMNLLPRTYLKKKLGVVTCLCNPHLGRQRGGSLVHWQLSLAR